VSLRVREPGVFSLPVDLGRVAYRHLGVPLGGAADRAAFVLGNALVGNPAKALALEVTLAGPVLEALHPTACVVFGAPFACAVNDRPTPAGVTLSLNVGDVLRILGTPRGVRAYLCVAGGLESGNVLGSGSALEPLRGGEVLRCRAARTEPRRLPFEHAGIPGTESPALLRALDGPQADWFATGALFGGHYEVSPASNRMGLRLRGGPIPRRPGELASEAVAPGAVQITNDGQPVVLGVDGQTIGGYPKIAHVIRADLDVLARLRPGDRVRFVRVGADEAETAARERAAFLHRWSTRLRTAERSPVLLGDPGGAASETEGDSPGRVARGQ
jgi:antagonist of KipI